MEKRITIKDISERTNLSYGTVHRALADKKGVSEKVRDYVVQVAEEMGYKPNFVASSLKRKTLNLVASFPEPMGRGKFFYTDVWKGFRDCVEQYRDYNISIIEVPYQRYNSEENQNTKLLSILNEYEGEINGLITQGNEEGEEVIRKYSEAGIPIVFACDDMPNIHRLCCVQANHYTTGKIAAEILTASIPDNSSVILCAGYTDTLSHKLSVEGFENYIKEESLNIKVLRVEDIKNADEVKATLKGYFEEDSNIQGMYSVNARDTVTLCQTAIEEGKVDKRLVGSDVFDENKEFMKQGVLNNLIYKNPSGQVFEATRILMDYLIKNEMPKEKIIYTDTAVIYKSNLYLY